MRKGIIIASALAFLPLAATSVAAQATAGSGGSEAVTGSTTTPGGTISITRAGSHPSQRGPSEWFTGPVRIDPLFTAPAPARAAGATVTFKPGAHTAWHTHPLGQTLVVLSGLGLVQREGGSVAEVRPGDVVWFPPGVKHWHGASPNTGMTHIAIQEALDGKAVEWLEHVTDAQYTSKGSKQP